MLYKNATLLELNRQTKITGQDNNNTGGGYCSCLVTIAKSWKLH